MMSTVILIFATLLAKQIDCGISSIPLALNAAGLNQSALDFALQLPNKDVIQVGLTFRLLTYPPTNYDNYDDNQTVFPTSTISAMNIIKPQFVTVEEAIEGFRKDLIKKEMDIAGIIESSSRFYRHFKLEFDDDEITIRCEYDSDYENRKLNISCYEYHEFETERILANGEVEYVKQFLTDVKSDVERVDLRKMKQTYNMEISK